MRRAMLYVRQSNSEGEGQESMSLESQERSLREYAAAHEWHVVGIERDVDVEGWRSTDRRQGLRRIMEAGLAGRYDILLVYSGSRFARDLILQESWIRDLEQSGVSLVSQTEPWFGDPLVRRLIGVVNEQYTRELSAHAKRTIRNRVEGHGVWCGGVPYGYRRPGPDQPLVFGPDEEVAAIRLMYRMYADGHGSTAIADVLNRSDLPAPTPGLPWHGNSIRKYLRSVAYRGTAMASTAIRRDAHPAMVDEGTLAAVDARLTDLGTRSPRRGKLAVSWLEGLVAHECGGVAYLKTQAHRNYRYFACSGRYHCTGRGCSRAAHLLEHDARALLVQAFAAVPDIETLIVRAHARASDLDRETAIRREQLVAARDAATRKLERTARLMIDGDLDQSWYDARRREALEERAIAERELARLPPGYDETAIREALDRVAAMTHAEVIASVTDTAILRRLLRSVGRIVYGASGIRLEFAPPYNAVFTTQRLRVVPATAASRSLESA